MYRSLKFFFLLWRHINNSSNENQAEPWKCTVDTSDCQILQEFLSRSFTWRIGWKGLAMSVALRFRVPLSLYLDWNKRYKMISLTSANLFHKETGQGTGWVSANQLQWWKTHLRKKCQQVRASPSAHERSHSLCLLTQKVVLISLKEFLACFAKASLKMFNQWISDNQSD